MNEVVNLLPMLAVPLVFACYLAPWLVAKYRQHNNSLAIFWLNLLLGWSLIGWVGALIWSLTSQKRGV